MDLPLTKRDPDRIAARIVELGDDWADRDAAASQLEEARKSILAAATMSAEGRSHAERETVALASPGYREHVRAMVEARREATRARVRYDSMRLWVDLIRSKESTARAEMALR